MDGNGRWAQQRGLPRLAGHEQGAKSIRECVDAEQWQERALKDGTRHRVYKRYFTGQVLADELGTGDVLHDGRWFVVVAAAGPSQRAA